MSLSPQNTAFPSQHIRAEDSIGLSFIRVYNLWHRKIKIALNPLEITHPQFIVMAAVGYLTTQSVEVKQVDISIQSDIDVMTVSKIILNLENKRLLLRSPSAIDSRAKVVRLTTQGATILAEALQVVEAIDQEFFGGLATAQAGFNQQLLRLVDMNQ
ncbi:MarR family transcriptional regulator [Acinetobacter calcoaceticus]|uniref:MarR family transcriptional regulator n=1 Tax=Acinetobacter calcoaceticus TaxID=471 RepID=A0A4R1Y5G8_ACICA|nr:MarR family transcriptional regulator [Acinetobacter calcoaceticus]